MPESYPDLHLDALRELANIGSGTAATALSRMLGRPVDISVPTALALPMADAVEAVGAPDTLITAVVLPLVGDLDAIALLMFGAPDAATLCGLLGVEADSEMGISALAEIGNILGCAYIGALSTMTQLALEPCPPETATDMLGAIVASVLATTAEDTDTALLLDSELTVEGAECALSFMLAPGRDGVAEILARLGLGE
ncbi:MAG TPA: chemotaxis protein CheC [Solirubrobacteraceae bacterium]|nr:chemotaxis protein CheC [Solirubrobacteraceae bacterium]